MSSEILIPVATTLITGAVVGIVGYLLAIYRADPKQIKEDIHNMREETRKEFVSLRKEFAEEFKELRHRMDSFSERISHLEGATGGKR